MPFSNVLPQFEEGALHSGSKSGPKVTNRTQAVAIMLSEKRAAAAGHAEYASHMPRGGSLSPTGDLSKLSQAETQRVFRRPIKRDGADISASTYLPVRPFKKAGGDNS